MAKPRFLLDEHVSRVVAHSLRQREPAIDVLLVGDVGMPPKGTRDPDLLIAAEGLGRILISTDRRTMPDHLRDHFLAGRHTAGVLLVRRNSALTACIDDLVLIWTATTADEWVDRTEYIPY